MPSPPTISPVPREPLPREPLAREEKNRDIEVLRAVAISFVMLSHWIPHALARVPRVGDWVEGHTALWSGVDLFFCVSGYVITLSLLRQNPGSAPFSRNAIPFWIRRIFRLWPSAWLWAAIAVLLSYTFNSSGIFGAPARTAMDAWMALCNLANFHDYECLREHSCGGLRIYWSLSLEEQFYWIFPFAVFLCKRRTLVGLLAVFTVSQLFLRRPMAFMWYPPNLLWLVRTDAICLGALIALATHTSTYSALKSRLLRYRHGVIACTALLFIILAMAAGSSFHITISTGILALASAALVGIASCNADLAFPRITSLEPLLMWIGARSYSLYLVHDVAHDMAAEIRARVPPSFGGVAWALYSLALTIGMTVAFAELNYRLIESPLRRVGRKVAIRREFPSFTSAVESTTE